MHWKTLSGDRLRAAAALLGLLVVGGCDSNGAAVGDGAAPNTPGGDAVSPDGAGDSPTWHQQVAPLIIERCAGCHVADGIAPFALDEYAAAAAFAPLIASAVESGSMPPFGARTTDSCEPPHPFRGDNSLSEDEIALLRRWADTGALEGDPTTAAALPPVTQVALDDVTMNVPRPDKASVDIEGTEDEFLCISYDPALQQDRWLDGVEVVPGNARVLHHALLYLDPNAESAALADETGYYPCFGGPGISERQLIGAWVPGSDPIILPERVGIRLPAGARILMNAHYHPTGMGVETDDSTSLNLRFLDEPPEYAAQLSLFGNAGNEARGLMPGEADDGSPRFLIPAGAEAHVENMTINLPRNIPDVRLWLVGNHMHYVGSSMTARLERMTPLADELDDECLLQTPQWDFDWQRTYVYDVPIDQAPILRGGDRLHLSCEYNNSLSNPKVREALDEQGLDAPRDVQLGDESLDEMCLVIVGAAVRLGG